VIHVNRATWPYTRGHGGKRPGLRYRSANSVNTPSTPVRWGILGYARIARENVIPAILRSTHSVLYALASRDDGKLAEARRRFEFAKGYTSYEELLGDPDVDAVYIPLPNALHVPWTLQAAAHGKHVLCEKPLALTAADCDRAIAACAERGVLLMEAFMVRYTARTAALVDVLRSGELGELRFIESEYRFRLSNPASIKLKPELGGGALFDVGCYAVDFVGVATDEVARRQSGLADAIGPNPESVSVASVREGGVDVSLSALLKYPGGLVAALHCGFNSEKRIFAEIVGTAGVLEIPDWVSDEAGTLTLTTAKERRGIPFDASDRYRLEIEGFVDAIQGRCPPRVRLGESARNARVLERIFAGIE
jgi:predicted dehydrogenase